MELSVNRCVNRILLIILLFLPGYLSAQDAVLELDLQKSLRMAMEMNHDIRIAKLNKLIADERVSEAWGDAVSPKIEATASYNRALKKGVFFIETPFFSGAIPQGTANTLGGGMTATQTLFSGSLFIAVRAAELYDEMVSEMYNVTKDELAVQVKRAYYSVLLMKEVKKLSESMLATAEENLKNTQAMYDAGLVAEYDLLRARVQVSNLVPQVTEAGKSLKIAENTLKITVGLDLHQEIRVEETMSYRLSVLPDMQESEQTVRERNPLLRQLRLETELRDKAISVAQAKYFPELSAVARWDIQAQEEDERPFDRWRYNNAVYVGVNMRVTLFNGFMTAAKVEQAELEKKITEETLLRQEKLLANRLQETVMTMKSQQEKIESYKMGIEQAEKAYSISKDRFSSGLATQLEVVDAMTAMTQAKVNYLTGVYEYLMTDAALQQLLSKEVL